VLSSNICASGEPSGALIQTNLDGLAMTAADVHQDIGQLLEMIQSEQEQATGRREKLEAEIPSLQSTLDEAQNDLDELSLANDQARTIYESMEEQRRWLSTFSEESLSIATVSAQAVPPLKASSPSKLMNTALAGVVGLMLSVAWVFAAVWWRTAQE
jgi:uncharacterized protein involved in exopolysaccharide biosynthesis